MRRLFMRSLQLPLELQRGKWTAIVWGLENYFLGFRQKKYFLGFRKLVSGVWAQKSGVLGFRMYVSWGLGPFVPSGV